MSNDQFFCLLFNLGFHGNLGLLFFWHKEIGAKPANKMLVKLTTGVLRNMRQFFARQYAIEMLVFRMTHSLNY
jgi:hypothetical protein